MEKKRPEFDPDHGADNRPVLACPACGFGFMHQCGVEVFSRDEEDSETGQHVSVNHGEQASVTNVVTTAEGNPSRRRDGIKIKFWCEDCRNKESPYELVIRQHKGNEHMFWLLDT